MGKNIMSLILSMGHCIILVSLLLCVFCNVRGYSSFPGPKCVYGSLTGVVVFVIIVLYTCASALHVDHYYNVLYTRIPAAGCLTGYNSISRYTKYITPSI